ncbi:MAG: DNA polymerase III subunit delta', partial [Methylotenera sp.]|nr:DNA polymerase III subunit delta' [Methylotenera sp.]
MNTLAKIYPWQADVWRTVNQDDKRRAHALLLHGRAGIGKYDFARCLSQALLCAYKDNLGHACGKCSSCNWFSEESHPDFRLLS